MCAERSDFTVRVIGQKLFIFIVQVTHLSSGWGKVGITRVSARAHTPHTIFSSYKAVGGWKGLGGPGGGGSVSSIKTSSRTSAPPIIILNSVPTILFAPTINVATSQWRGPPCDGKGALCPRGWSPGEDARRGARGAVVVGGFRPGQVHLPLLPLFAPPLFLRVRHALNPSPPPFFFFSGA